MPDGETLPSFHRSSGVIFSCEKDEVVKRIDKRKTKQCFIYPDFSKYKIGFYSWVKSALSSVASSGFIFPPRINLTCLLLNAPSNNFFSPSVSGIIEGTGLGLPFGS